MDRQRYEMLGIDQMTVDSKLELIKLISQDLYSNSRRAFRPMYPWVFVQMLPKEQMYKNLIITPVDQNKPVHEGIVLATWAPFNRHVARHMSETNRILEKWTEMRSEFEPGDHVLFPHWAGRPISGFDDERFRVVREEQWSETGDGGIFAKVDYDEDFATEHGQLTGLLIDMMSARDSTVACNDEQAAALGASQIEDHFTLLSKLHKSVTYSGR